MAKTILIMAGGTGGHVFPGLAVADYLRDLGWRVVWLGTRAGMEQQLVPKRGYIIETMKIETYVHCLMGSKVNSFLIELKRYTGIIILDPKAITCFPMILNIKTARIYLNFWGTTRYWVWEIFLK